jgi:outer membrane protein TolC
MSRPALLFLAVAGFLRAETHPMTLRQAAEAAMKQNPDVFLAHMEEDKARAGVRIARQPFVPRVVVGSGLAYSDGFPMSIEGSAPSVMQANAVATIFNRPLSFQVAQAKEDARGAAIAVTAKRDEVAYRITALFLEAERAARLGSLARKAVESQQTVLDTVHAQVAEGRALPLAEKQAALALARASQAAENLDDAQAAAETSLAIALGFSAQDRVHPAERDRPLPALPESQDRAIQTALDSNVELRQLQSQLMSKELERRGQKAGRLPRMDLVAQYGMLAQFNNYSEFFQKFQRNNVELGVSFQLPLFSPAVGAQVSQTDADLNRLRVEMTSARNRIAADIQESFREVRKAETAANVARLDLEVARAQLDVTLAQMREGRAPLRQVEEARLLENDKWMAFHDAQFTVEKARWNVLRFTGGLLPAIASLPAQ